MPAFVVVYSRFHRSNPGAVRSVYEVAKIVFFFFKSTEIQKVD